MSGLIILGSTRSGRNGKQVADWVVDRAGARTDAEYISSVPKKA
jgi:NAD(P)H-dependent FMN reductase